MVFNMGILVSASKIRSYVHVCWGVWVQGERTMGAVRGQAWAALRWFVSCDYQVLLLGSPAEDIITHSEEGCTMELITIHTGNCHVEDKSSQCKVTAQPEKPPVDRCQMT